MEKLEDFGELQDLQGSNPDDNLKLHPRADVKYTGGLLMPDNDKVIPKFV